MPVLLFIMLLVYYGGQSYMNFEIVCWGLVFLGILCYSADKSK